MKYILFLLLFLGGMKASAQMIDSTLISDWDSLQKEYQLIDCPLFVVLDKEEDYGMLWIRVPAHESQLRFELYTCDTASKDLRCKEAHTRVFTLEPNTEEERFSVKLNEVTMQSLIHINYDLFSNGELIRSCRTAAL